MKTLLHSLLVVLLGATTLHAADRYWGGSDTDLLNGTPVIPGDGAWSTTIANWADSTASPTYFPWASSDNAIFATTASNYTVEMREDLVVGDITVTDDFSSQVNISQLSGNPREELEQNDGGVVHVGDGAVLNFPGGGSENEYVPLGDLTKTGTGRWQFTRFFSNVTIPNGSTFDILEGEFQYNGNRAFEAPGATVHIAAGATFDDQSNRPDGSSFVGGQKEIGALTGSGTYIGRTSPKNDIKSNLQLQVGTGDLTSTFSGTFEDGQASRPLSFVKEGTGTFTFAGTSTTAGFNFVDEGTLIIDGDWNGTGDFTVEDGATLGGSGFIGGGVFADTAATLSPGSSVGTLTIGLITTISGTYLCEIDGASADSFAVSGDLILTGSTVDFDELSAPTEPNYTIATYTGSRTGTFTAVDLPTGYSIDYGTPGQIILTTAAVSDPYADWAASNITAIDAGADASFTGNPDGDPFDNGLEWILGGDPLGFDSTDDLLDPEGDATTGLTLNFTREDDSVGEATLTVEFSDDLFDADINLSDVPATSGTVNGVTYTIDDSADPDTVIATIPASNASADGKLFGRVAASQ